MLHTVLLSVSVVTEVLANTVQNELMQSRLYVKELLSR